MKDEFVLDMLDLQSLLDNVISCIMFPQVHTWASQKNIDLCFLFRHCHQPSGRLMCVRYYGPRDPRSKEC